MALRLSLDAQQILRLIRDLAVTGREIIVLAPGAKPTFDSAAASTDRFGAAPLGLIAAELLPPDFDENDAGKTEPYEAALAELETLGLVQPTDQKLRLIRFIYRRPDGEMIEVTPVNWWDTVGIEIRLAGRLVIGHNADIPVSHYSLTPDGGREASSKPQPPKPTEKPGVVRRITAWVLDLSVLAGKWVLEHILAAVIVSVLVAALLAWLGLG